MQEAHGIATAGARPRLRRSRGWAARLDEVDLPVVLRPAFVVAQAASILITWALWQARTSPPPLPVIGDLGQIDMGLILLATLVLVLFKPTAGVIAHSVALGAAIAMDQTRLQPEFVSIALLLWGTTRFPYARVIACAHLASLWFWAGLNKALSLDFIDQSAAFLFNAFPLHPEFLRPVFGWIIVATEISIGVLLLIPRWRRAGIGLAIGLHVLGLVALVNIGWNESVWPWNAALAIGAVAFFWAPVEWCPRGSLAVALALGVMPVGFYAGYVDAYVAHNLYTSNTASAYVCDAGGACRAGPWSETWTELRVPLPPEPRLFLDFFEEVCEPGETLVTTPRRTRLVFGRDTDGAKHDCPSAST